MPLDRNQIAQRAVREIESGPYLPYREGHKRVMRRLFAAAPSHEFATLADAVGTWQPFPDTLDALRRLGHPPERVLQAAESRFHDIAPARALGLRTAWVNRGQSASGSSGATPDAEVPTVGVLADLLGV